MKAQKIKCPECGKFVTLTVLPNPKTGTDPQSFDVICQLCRSILDTYEGDYQAWKA
jgi:hypothetical protein